jgi:hypothetical protein
MSFRVKSSGAASPSPCESWVPGAIQTSAMASATAAMASHAPRRDIRLSTGAGVCDGGSSASGS